MDRQEAIDVLETMKDMYPKKFDVNKRKAKLVLPELQKMDYDQVMQNLANHVIHYPYPPTISEIAGYPTEENEYINQLAEWRKEAATVPEEVKTQFKHRLQMLLSEKMNHDH